MRALLLVFPLIGCTSFGPDLSANTIGPIVVNTIQMPCKDALGCTICYERSSPPMCIIYVLPDVPQQVLDEEWAHTKGWRH